MQGTTTLTKSILIGVTPITTKIIAALLLSHSIVTTAAYELKLLGLDRFTLEVDNVLHDAAGILQSLEHVLPTATLSQRLEQVRCCLSLAADERCTVA